VVSLPEAGYFDVLAGVLDGLDGCGKIAITRHEYANIINAFVRHGQHIYCDVNVYALFNIRVPTKFKTTQASLKVRDSRNRAEKSLLGSLSLGIAGNCSIIVVCAN